MIYIEAIEKIDEDELFNKHGNKDWIFLAGSILFLKFIKV